MRDLLYKNLTSFDRSRKIIASSEITDKEGIHSVVRRHFACMVKEPENTDPEKQRPYLYVVKERNTKQKREHFFCKIKGSFLAENKGKLLHILFIHTLRVELSASAKLGEQTG
ncbi:MAG: hypothetical protein PHP73_02690 [Candidatus Omnitrophica bacterium]|nr:hypothetical protein [Candidatus Omnitrophota bacterium]